MKLRRGPGDEVSPTATGAADDHAGKLSGVRPTPHQDDERPRREDLDYGSTIFTRPAVPLPRFLKGRKKPPQPD